MAMSKDEIEAMMTMVEDWDTPDIVETMTTQIPDLNPKQLELGLKVKVEDRYEGDL